MLFPNSGNQLRSNMDLWLDKHRIHPQRVSEFDDSALMKAFGKEGAGIFIAPTTIETEVELQYQVTAIGQTDEVKEYFYAISVERQVKNPVVSTILMESRRTLFAEKGAKD